MNDPTNLVFSAHFFSLCLRFEFKVLRGVLKGNTAITPADACADIVPLSAAIVYSSVMGMTLGNNSMSFMIKSSPECSNQRLPHRQSYRLPKSILEYSSRPYLICFKVLFEKYTHSFLLRIRCESF